jgi:hypothetical protein
MGWARLSRTNDLTLSTYIFTINFLDRGRIINRGSSGARCYRFAAFKTRP